MVTRNKDILDYARDKRELLKFKTFDKAIREAQSGEKVQLQNNVNLAGRMAMDLCTSSGIRHVVGVLVQTSKDPEARKETVIYAVDSIMRHVLRVENPAGIERYEKHLQSHLPNFFKRALRFEGTRQNLSAKFTDKILPKWRQRKWFKEAIPIIFELIHSAAPDLKDRYVPSPAEVPTESVPTVPEGDAGVEADDLRPDPSPTKVDAPLQPDWSKLPFKPQVPASPAVLAGRDSVLLSVPMTPRVNTVLGSVPMTPGGGAAPGTPNLGGMVAPGTPRPSQPYTPVPHPSMARGAAPSTPKAPSNQPYTPRPAGPSAPFTPALPGSGTSQPFTPTVSTQQAPFTPNTGSIQPFTPGAPGTVQPFTPAGTGGRIQPFTPSTGSVQPFTPGAPGTVQPFTPGASGSMQPFTPGAPSSDEAHKQPFTPAAPGSVQPFTPGPSGVSQMPFTPGAGQAVAQPGTPGLPPLTPFAPKGGINAATPFGAPPATPGIMPGTPGFVPFAGGAVAPMTPGLPGARPSPGTPGFVPFGGGAVAPMTPAMPGGGIMRAPSTPYVGSKALERAPTTPVTVKLAVKEEAVENQTISSKGELSAGSGQDRTPDVTPALPGMSGELSVKQGELTPLTPAGTERFDGLVSPFMPGDLSAQSAGVKLSVVSPGGPAQVPELNRDDVWSETPTNTESKPSSDKLKRPADVLAVPADVPELQKEDVWTDTPTHTETEDAPPPKKKKIL